MPIATKAAKSPSSSSSAAVLLIVMTVCLLITTASAFTTTQWYCAVSLSKQKIFLATASLAKAQASMGIGNSGDRQAIVPMDMAGDPGHPNILDKSWPGGSMWWMGTSDITTMMNMCKTGAQRPTIPAGNSKWKLSPAFRDRTMQMLPQHSKFGHWKWGAGETGQDTTGHFSSTTGANHTDEGLHVGAGCTSKGCPSSSTLDIIGIARGYSGTPSGNELLDFSLVVRLQQNAPSKTSAGVTLVFATSGKGRYDGLVFERISSSSTSPGARYGSELYNRDEKSSQSLGGTRFFQGDYNGFDAEEEELYTITYNHAQTRYRGYRNGIKLWDYTQTPRYPLDLNYNNANKPDSIYPSMSFGPRYPGFGNFDALLFEVVAYNITLEPGVDFPTPSDWEKKITESNKDSQLPIPINRTSEIFSGQLTRQVVYDALEDVVYTTELQNDKIRVFNFTGLRTEAQISGLNNAKIAPLALNGFAPISQPIGMVPWRNATDYEMRRPDLHPSVEYRRLRGLFVVEKSTTKIKLLPLEPTRFKSVDYDLGDVVLLLQSVEKFPTKKGAWDGAKLKLAAHYHNPQTLEYRMYFGGENDACLLEVVLSRDYELVEDVEPEVAFGICSRKVKNFEDIKGGGSGVAAIGLSIFGLVIVNDGSTAIVANYLAYSRGVYGTISNLQDPDKSTRVFSLIHLGRAVYGLALNTYVPSSANNFILYMRDDGYETMTYRHHPAANVNHSTQLRFLGGRSAINSGVMLRDGFLVHSTSIGLSVACCADEYFNTEPVVAPPTPTDSKTVSAATPTLSVGTPSSSLSRSDASATGTKSIGSPSATHDATPTEHYVRSATATLVPTASAERTRSASLLPQLRPHTQTAIMATEPPPPPDVVDATRTPSLVPPTPVPETPAPTPKPKKKIADKKKEVLQNALGNEEAAEAVNVASTAAPAAAAMANPAAATNAARVASIAAIADCTFDEDTLDPSSWEHPIPLKLGNSDASLLAGSALMSFIVFIAPFMIAILVMYNTVAPPPPEERNGDDDDDSIDDDLKSLVSLDNEGGSGSGTKKEEKNGSHTAGATSSSSSCMPKLLQGISFFSTITISYFIPLVSGAATTLLCHPEAGDALTSSVGAFLVLSIIAVVATLATVVIRFFDDNVAVVTLVLGERREIEYENHRRARKPYCEAVAAFFESSGKPFALRSRLYFFEDVMMSVAMMVVTSVRPASENGCLYVGGVMCCIAMSHILYISLVRPYQLVLEAAFMLVHAVVQLAMCACGLASIYKPSAGTALAYLIAAEASLFFIQAVVMGAWSIWHWRMQKHMRRDENTVEEEMLRDDSSSDLCSSSSDTSSDDAAERRRKSRQSAAAKRVKGAKRRRLRVPKTKDDAKGLFCEVCNTTWLKCRCDDEMRCIESDEEDAERKDQQAKKERGLAEFKNTAATQGALFCAVCAKSRLSCTCDEYLQIEGEEVPWERRAAQVRSRLDRKKKDSTAAVPLEAPASGPLVCSSCGQSRFKCKCDDYDI